MKQREDMILKYKALKSKQSESDTEAIEESKEEMSLRDIINDIKEEFFSDL